MTGRDLLWIALALAAISCTDSKAVDLEDQPYAVVADGLPASLDAIDLLFVIDNSGSMAEEQAALALHAETALLQILSKTNGSLPDLHIAVVSTDMGGGSDVACVGNGDNGSFQSSHCLDSGDFIVDLSGDGDARDTNYQGTLSDALGCMVELGTSGCGFEQPLLSVERALDFGSRVGFLRDDALLSVIIITDEDDCSASDPANLFNPDPALDTMDSELGALSSYRCFEFGTVCDPDEPRAPGEKTGCTPRAESPYLVNVGDVAETIRGYKDKPNLVTISTIMGPATGEAYVQQVERADRPANRANALVIGESCESNLGSAYPGFRLGSFAEEFVPARRQISSICDNNFSTQLEQTAHLIDDTTTGRLCLRAQLTQETATRSCRVMRQADDGTDLEIPHCDAGAPGECFAFATTEECAHVDSGLGVVLEASPTTSLGISVQCLTAQ